jgi:hypothetical protein
MMFMRSMASFFAVAMLVSKFAKNV